ncbi:MAG: hypothetical protein N3F66_03645 [Spirochaetes bacterium]|nr:hypothetical protein [Spirochaetota bacterium]
MARQGYSIFFTIIIFCSAILLLGFHSSLCAKTNDQNDDKAFTLNGYYKNLFIGYKTSEYYTKDYLRKEKLLLTDVNRFRLSPDIDITNNILLHADIDNECIISNYTHSPNFTTMWIGYSYNQLYTEHYDYSNDSLYYRLKLHRAFVKIISGKSTVTIGRQLVRFGSGKIWNPLDIVNPISPLAFEGAEEAKGVDAMRFELYPAPFFEVSFVYVPQRKNDDLSSESFSNSVYLLRNKIVIGGTDVAVLCGKIMQRIVSGVDVSTVLYDGLLKGSILGTKDGNTMYFIAGAGYEYSFECGINFLAEYFYNGNCLSKNPELQNAYYESLLFGMNEERYKNLAYNFLTYNAHYAGVSTGFSGASLFSGSVTTIIDVQGHGIMIIPNIVYNIIENCDITLYVLYAIVTGKGSTDFNSFDNKSLIAGELKYYF